MKARVLNLNSKELILIADSSFGPAYFWLINKHGKVLKRFSLKAFRDSSSSIPQLLGSFVESKNDDLPSCEITEIYIGFGPGAFTSIKVFLSSILTFQLLTKTSVFCINSLSFWKKISAKKDSDFLSYAGKEEFYTLIGEKLCLGNIRNGSFENSALLLVDEKRAFEIPENFKGEVIKLDEIYDNLEEISLDDFKSGFEELDSSNLKIPYIRNPV